MSQYSTKPSSVSKKISLSNGLPKGLTRGGAIEALETSTILHFGLTLVTVEGWNAKET